MIFACSFLAVFSCSTIISGGIKLNEETGELNLTKATQTIGASKIQLYDFPEYNDRERCLVTLSNGDILSCGGKSKKCFVLANQGWIEHSTLDKDRSGSVGIQMPDGIYLFGGIQSPYTSHFLPNNTTVWQKGPEIPYINGSLMSFGSNFWKRIAWVIFPCDYKANGHAISETELILIQEDCIITVHI